MLFELNSQLEKPLMGQKALSLAELSASGFLIPRSLVLSTKAFELFLRTNGLWERAKVGGDRHLSASIVQGQWPTELKGFFHTILTQLGPNIAVRSSAIDEDGNSKSFAGQYESILGVSDVDGLKEAVLKCWASYYSHRVLLYRGQNHAPPAGMAVLLQRQVDPSHAGVCFSVNPMTGAWNELVIEAFPGAGEHVVSGHVLPDYYALARPKRLLPLGLRIQLRKGPKVIEQSIPSKNAMPVVVLNQLWTDALRLERQFGCPQDIEWAYSNGQLFLLQHRPVTTQPREMAGETLWSQAFIGERWNEPAHPLSWSLISKQLRYLIEYPKTARQFYGGDQSLKLYEHAPYLNLSPFRHLIFKGPGARPPGFMLELLPEAEAALLKQRFVRMPNFSFYASILQETFLEKRWRRFSWNPMTNWLDWNAFEEELKLMLQQDQHQHHDHLFDLWHRHQKYSALSQRYIGIHICSLLFANIGYQLANWWLSSDLTVEECAQVLRSYRTSPTTFTNHALWKLAHGELSLDDFIEQFGHRAPNSWELFSVRWCEDPEQLKPLMAMLLNQPSPLSKERESLRRAADILKRLSISKQMFIRDVQRYLYLREAQRFTFDRLLLSWKRVLLQIGDQIGVEVRWLRAEELESVVHATLAGQQPDPKWAAMVEQRQKAWNVASKRWARGERPPFVLRTEEVSNEPLDHHHRGIGISPGCARGPARVLSSIAEARQLQPGEILVVRSTDPAWTPLFVPAAGVIMELGGMLSHGAIVARECGTPAVSGIERITTLIKTGDILELDGRRGSVVICS